MHRKEMHRKEMHHKYYRDEPVSPTLRTEHIVSYPFG